MCWIDAHRARGSGPVPQRALLENGVRSVLVTYPEEGHGIYKMPALIDYLARAVGWFEEHLGVS